MKKFCNFALYGLTFTFFIAISACSSDPKDGPGHHDWASFMVDFNNIPENLIGGPTSYGANLYYGAKDQITGYLYNYENSGFCVQFPVNYGQTWDNSNNQIWAYSFFNGGMAVSNWHDMEDGSYLNQLSVYAESSPSGGNFVVANGSSMVTDPTNAKYSDYDGCGHIYLTDEKGYKVVDPGAPQSKVSGNGPAYNETFFVDIAVANTTYVYHSLKYGNDFANAINKENKGWFKVQFIAFTDDDPDGEPAGYVETYLANFDNDLKSVAGFSDQIREGWLRVDLSSLPLATILVVNFVGSDMGQFGLNTPAYCALDDLGIVYW